MNIDIFDYVQKNFGFSGAILSLVTAILLKLAWDLAKLRTDLQQQIAKDLLNKRFASYGQLWEGMGKLALYSDDELSSAELQGLRESLSQWYFSAAGGMFLTATAREFYFGLQDTLEAAANLKGWKCTRRPDNIKVAFRGFLSAVVPRAEFAAESLDHPEKIDPQAWRRACMKLAAALKALPQPEVADSADKVYVTVQQVSSALRSILAYELHTRLKADAAWF